MNARVLVNFKETPEEKRLNDFPGCFFPILMFICLIAWSFEMLTRPVILIVLTKEPKRLRKHWKTARKKKCRQISKTNKCE